MKLGLVWIILSLKEKMLYCLIVTCYLNNAADHCAQNNGEKPYAELLFMNTDVVFIDINTHKCLFTYTCQQNTEIKINFWS